MGNTFVVMSSNRNAKKSYNQIMVSTPKVGLSRMTEGYPVIDLFFFYAV